MADRSGSSNRPQLNHQRRQGLDGLPPLTPAASRAGAAGPNGTDAPLHLGGRGCAARQFATTVRALPGCAARTRCWNRQLLSGPPPPALPPPPCAGGAGATGPSGADAPPPQEGRAARTTAVRTGPPHALPLTLPAGQADAPLGEHDEPPLRGPPPPPPVPQPTLPAGRGPWGQALLTHRRRGTPLRGPQQARPPPPPRRGRAVRTQRRRMPGVRGPPPPARSCAACPAVCAVLKRGQNQVHHTHMTPVPFF